MMVLANWRGLAIRGAVAALFGIVTLLWPGLTLTALVLLFGAFVLVDGIVTIGNVVAKTPGTESQRGMHLLEGALGVAIGLVTLFWPGITGLVLLYLIAAWAIITGILEIVAAVALRGEVQRDWVLAIVGGLSLAFGILLMITPGAGALIITWLIGWYALFAGVVLLYLAWRVRQAEATGGAIGQARPLPT